MVKTLSKNNIKISEANLKTSITKVEPNKIITRGYSQSELIENLSFSDMIFLLLKGNLPTKKQSKIFQHVLVSFADHGITPPSTQTAKIIASSGSPLNNAVAGGLLSFGKNHAGAIKNSMELFQNQIQKLNANNENENKLLAKMAIDIVNEYNDKNLKIPGFGHRYHSKDPRANKLLEIVIEEGFIGPHVKLAIVLDNLLSDKKNIHLNVDGINGAILSDLGFDSDLGLGVFMIGRMPGLIAHSYEEMIKEEDFRKFVELDDIEYEGADFTQ